MDSLAMIHRNTNVKNYHCKCLNRALGSSFILMAGCARLREATKQEICTRKRMR